MASLQDLLQRQSVWRGGTPAPVAGAALASGFAELDRALPGGGWPAGGLTEIFCERDGIGEVQLVLPAFAALTREAKRVAWIAPPHLPYAPALAAAGLDLAHLAVVRAPGRRDALWAAEQVLRSGACHALLAWLPQARYAELRRLAVAAEAGRAFVALFRPLLATAEPSPAVLRLLLEPNGPRLAAHVLKRRGAPVEVPLDIPVHRPPDALGRARLPAAAARSPAARPRLVALGG